MLDAQALYSIKLSLKVSFLATAFVFLTGLPLAYLFATRNFRFKNFFDAILMLPIVFPPTVTGYILLVLLGKEGILGKIIYETLHFSFIFTWQGAVIAGSVASFPIFLKGARSAIESVDKKLIWASYTLGKSEVYTFFKVVFPLAKRGIIASLILSFARAIGEFGATLMVAGNIPFKTNTIPLEIYSAVSGGDFQKANVLAVLMAVISLGIIYTVNKLSGSRKW